MPDHRAEAPDSPGFQQRARAIGGLFLSLAHTDDEIDAFVCAAGDVLSELYGTPGS